MRAEDAVGGRGSLGEALEVAKVDPNEVQEAIDSLAGSSPETFNELQAQNAAVKINDLLRSKGFADADLTPWWNESQDALGGRSATAAWQARDFRIVMDLASGVPDR